MKQIYQKKAKLLPLKMREWILPTWFQNQNNPLAVFYTISNLDFFNQADRNWTTLGNENAKHLIQVDQYGVLHLPKVGISVEIWLHTGEELYTPGKFLSITQSNFPCFPGIKTCHDFGTGTVETVVFPLMGSSGDSNGIEISIFSEPVNALKPVSIYLTIRPYDNEGLSWIRKLEYKNSGLYVNGRKTITLEREPKHSFFTNLTQGDVTHYFHLGEGNTRTKLYRGLCTGMLGYTGLPADLTPLRLTIIANHHLGMKKEFTKQQWLTDCTKTWQDQYSKNFRLIQTGSILDDLIITNLSYLQIFRPVNINHFFYQIMAFNRYSLTGKSLSRLQKCFQKIRCFGLTSLGFLNTAKLILAAADYYKFSRDENFLEKNWPLLKRMGHKLCRRKEGEGFPKTNRFAVLDWNIEGFYENNCWVAAALKALAYLANVIGKSMEAQVYEEQFHVRWFNYLNSLANFSKGKEKKIIPLFVDGGKGGGVVKNLAASFPLQLWEPGEPYVLDTLDLVLKEFLHEGGVISPFDFKGIDLELTVKLCQILVREELSYNRILDYLMATASPTWTWPDRVHPVSKKGIGKTGHDPLVGSQALILLRNMMTLEEGNELCLLPGVFSNHCLEFSQIKLDQIPTFYGEFSLSCSSIGRIIQIDFSSSFHTHPKKVRLNLGNAFKLLYSDADFSLQNEKLEVDPGFRTLRLQRVN